MQKAVAGRQANRSSGGRQRADFGTNRPAFCPVMRYLQKSSGKIFLVGED
jgi:hypothetical protein